MKFFFLVGQIFKLNLQKTIISMVFVTLWLNQNLVCFGSWYVFAICPCLIWREQQLTVKWSKDTVIQKQLIISLVVWSKRAYNYTAIDWLSTPQTFGTRFWSSVYIARKQGVTAPHWCVYASRGMGTRLGVHHVDRWLTLTSLWLFFFKLVCMGLRTS